MTILNTTLTNSTASNIYASSGTSAITTIHLCNFSANTQTVNVYIVPGGSIASSNNIIYSNVTVTAYNTYIVYAEKFILANGDSIRANCSNSGAVAVTVSSIGI